MPDRHLDGLFAEAADDLLGGAARDRFDDHLAGCDRCSEAFADHRAARDAVRAMAPARMPVPVRLPAHAPRSVRDSWSRRLADALGRRGGLVAAGGLAAVAGAAVLVVAVAGWPSGTSSVAVSQATAPRAAGQSGVADQRPVDGSTGTAFGAASASSSAGGGGPGVAGAGAPAPAALVAPTAAPLAPASGRPPAGFTNRVDVQSQGRPGEVLVLAAPATAYNPGDQVTIYAAVLTGTESARTDSGAVAQVELRTAPAGGSSSSGSSPSAGGGSVLATAVRDSSGLYHLTIPASYRAGGSLLVVADVPAGSPSPADRAPIEAQLGLTLG